MNSILDYDDCFHRSLYKRYNHFPGRKRVVDGGAFNYGSMFIRMGLKVAAITRLAQRIIMSCKLKDLGVDVFLTPSEHSTCLTIEYPTNNVDERILSITSFAGPFSYRCRRCFSKSLCVLLFVAKFH